MPDTITITDDRTGKQVTVPIEDGVFPSSALRELDPDLRMYDPAFLSTAACASAVTYLDGEAGILRYRGYPIEQLAEHSTYLEVAYLLLNGELPTAEQLKAWTYDVTHHTFLHDNVRKRFMEGFHYDAHPMGMFVSGLAALSTYYPEAKDIFDATIREKQVLRLIAKIPHAGGLLPPLQRRDAHRLPEQLALVHGELPQHDVPGRRRLRGLPRPGPSPRHPVHPPRRPRAELRHDGHAGGGLGPRRPVHRLLGGGASALYGPLHGGANEAVVRMLGEIGSMENVPGFIEYVKAGKGRLMGFGHRVYKNFDPRATIIKKTAYDVFEVTGKNPLLDIALKLEEVALSDDYFKSRKLYANVDFYSGLIYQAMDFPVDMFTVLFAIPRTSGWLAHWVELLGDKEQKIARPRQAYDGVGLRDYIPIEQRS